MKKYIVAIWRMIKTKNWLVITMENETSIKVVSNNVTTHRCWQIGESLKEMGEETAMQHDLLNQFKNN